MVHLLKVRMQNGGGYRAVKTNDSLNQKASKPRKVNFTVRTASNVGHPSKQDELDDKRARIRNFRARIRNLQDQGQKETELAGGQIL